MHRTRTLWLAAALALASSAPAADDLVIPALRDGAGQIIEATVSVRLTDAAGAPAIGWDSNTLGPVTEYQRLQLAEDLTLPLLPNAEIGTEDGAATFYAVVIETRQTSRTWRVQMPASATPVQLADLIGAEAIAAASVPGWRLLPDAATDGQFATYSAAVGRWIATTVEPGAGVEEAPVDGAAYCRQDGGWVGCETGGGAETDPVFSASPAAGITADDLTEWAAAMQPGDLASALGSGVSTGGAVLMADGSGGTYFSRVQLDSDTDSGLPWDRIVNTPTTCAGYGIADCGIAAESDPVFLVSLAAGITADNLTEWATAYGWGDHAQAGYLTTESDPNAPAAAAAAVTEHVGQSHPHTQYELKTNLGTAAYTAADDYATAAQGALAETAIQPSTPGACGVQTLIELGDVSDVTVTLDGSAYRANLTGLGDLTVLGAAPGELRFAVLYLTSDGGGWELSTPFSAYWLDGSIELLSPGLGEMVEVIIRLFPDGTLLLSARPYL